VGIIQTGGYGYEDHEGKEGGVMGHPWKRQRAEPKSPEQLFGEYYPLWEYINSPEFVEKGRQRKEKDRMKQNHRKLLEKNRLLKRKISEFYKQGEEYGKGSNKR
jgi:hypothetical protein